MLGWVLGRLGWYGETGVRFAACYYFFEVGVFFYQVVICCSVLFCVVDCSLGLREQVVFESVDVG